MTEAFSDPQELKDFLLGGNAVFSVRSVETGNHFTYRIKPPKKDPTPGVFFVELLGSDQVFRYFGNIMPAGNFIYTRKTPAYFKDHPAAQGFALLWQWLEKDRMHPRMEVFHQGKCSVCGIRLTHPKSIKLGIGPECRKKKGRRR
jgi:hypothetical protein